MAKAEKPSGKGKIKFRYIEFEMDGGDPTLQDAIREITRAISRPQISKAVAAPGQGSATNGQDTTLITAQDNEESDEPAASDEDVVTEQTATDRTPKTRRYKSPSIVKVELRGDNALRQFLERISPESVPKRYLAIAYWFKTYRHTPEINPDHLYTAYKEMNWSNLPKDVAAVLRTLKFEGSFDKGSGKQGYVLNHIGEGKVQDMINKTNTK